MNTLLDAADSRARHFPNLSHIGALLADPGRAAMLWSLMDGTARPAGELTMIVGLVAIGGERPPRAPHRRRAAGAQSQRTASLLPNRDAGYRDGHRSARQSGSRERAAASARTSAERDSGRNALCPHVLRPPRGRTGRARVRRHARAQLARARRRPVRSPGRDATRRHARRRAGIRGTGHRHEGAACTCINWSERRPHLGGALGATFLETCETHGWIEHTAKRRVPRVTPSGKRHFEGFLSER